MKGTITSLSIKALLLSKCFIVGSSLPANNKAALFVKSIGFSKTPLTVILSPPESFFNVSSLFKLISGTSAQVLSLLPIIFTK